MISPSIDDFAEDTTNNPSGKVFLLSNPNMFECILMKQFVGESRCAQQTAQMHTGLTNWPYVN